MGFPAVATWRGGGQQSGREILRAGCVQGAFPAFGISLGWPPAIAFARSSMDSTGRWDRLLLLTRNGVGCFFVRAAFAGTAVVL